MKKVYIIILLILLTGCKENSKTQTIEMKCNGTNTIAEIKENDVLSCKLLNEQYEFKILKITNKDITIEVNDYGLTDTNSLIKKEKKYKIINNDELILHTQTTDYQESVIFKRKD